MDRPLLALRAATPDELRLVRSSWFESFRKGGCAPEVGFDVYRREMNLLITRLASSQSVTVSVPVAVPDEVCGWICSQKYPTGWAVHYVYVKHAYRRQGIGTQLLTHVGAGEYTHETHAGAKLVRKFGMKFNPFLLLSR